jgi:hypothetical protein
MHTVRTWHLIIPAIHFAQHMISGETKQSPVNHQRKVEDCTQMGQLEQCVKSNDITMTINKRRQESE